MRNSYSFLPHGCFFALASLSLLIFHRPLGTLVGGSLTVDQYSPVVFVVPVSLALLWMGRRRIFARPQFFVPAGLAFLLIVILGRFGRTLSISVLLFVLSVIAAFVFCHGVRSFRAAAFPLLFLLLMAPLPDMALARVITFLQLSSADATAMLFRMAGIPFSRSGTVLALPSVTIEIAQECSGIRSSLVLFLSSLVVGHLFLKSGWTKLALALAVIPITIAKNGLRIFALSTLAMYVDPSFLTGSLHRDGGIVFFVLAFGCLWLLVAVFQRVETHSRTALPVAPSALASSAPWKGSS